MQQCAHFGVWGRARLRAGLAMGLLCAVSAPWASAVAADAKAAVEEELKKTGADKHAQIATIEDETVKSIFPDQSWVTVVFPQYPYPRTPPPSFAVANLYGVAEDGTLTLFTQSGGLQDWALVALAEVDMSEKCGDVVHAWMRLTQEFSADGFFQFNVDDGTTRCSARTPFTAMGRSVAVQQNEDTGRIDASFTIDATGKLASIREDRQMYPGIRPHD